MKKVKIIALPTLVLAVFAGVTAFTKSKETTSAKEPNKVLLIKNNQPINLFVSHGHCNTPYGGVVDNLLITAPKPTDNGNPLENMQVSFEIRSKSFKQCVSDKSSQNHQSAAVFLGEGNNQITFKSTSVKTIGLDWYEINGKMSIKGVSKDVTLNASGVRKGVSLMPSALVIESGVNLLDWGIDYDKIVKGKSSDRTYQWMQFNMTINMS